MQEAEVRKLAERYGDTDLLVLGDIGRSGRKKERRPDYQRLLELVEAGQVSAVYAYSLSRLNRSTRDYADFADLCVTKCVPVRLCHEGEQDFSTPAGRLIATILSAVAQMQAEIDSERARDVIRARRANGERHGEPLTDLARARASKPRWTPSSTSACSISARCGPTRGRTRSG